MSEYTVVCKPFGTNHDHPTTAIKYPCGLPCCTTFIPRTEWIGSLYAPNITSPQQLADQFPFWASQWKPQGVRNQPILPTVYYSPQIQPRGTLSVENLPDDLSLVGPNIVPNWSMRT